MIENVTVLPAPLTDRWRPTRAGLIGIWRYWDETFTFHRGRLLLRGPNGSGKSMALELLLPFLLDADASPARLTSAARSRGGLYERLMTGSTDASRAGYAWVEFRRGEGVFTVGARMRGSTATRKVDLDFFTTTQEVGTDLHLLDDQRVPLSRKSLIEAIGSAGRVHSSGEEHRSAVREGLFGGFGPDRYGSVITALLALRKEKLSQNLDLDKLSEVLSEALPALDEHDLATVAEGFERLDRRRADLATLEAEVTEVRALAARQRAYARAVMADVAAGVRSAESDRDKVTRTEREAREQLDRAGHEAGAVAGELSVLDGRLAQLEVEIDALRTSDAYREGASLDHLRHQAQILRAALERATQALADGEVRLEAATASTLEAEATSAQAAANLELAERQLRQCSLEVGAEGVLDDVMATDAAHEADIEAAGGLIRAWIEVQRSRIAEVRAAIETHRAAVQQRGFHEGQVEQDSATVDQRITDRQHAAATLADVVAAYVAAVTDWVAGCGSIGAGRLQAVLPAPPDDPATVHAAVGALAAELAGEHALALDDLDRRQRDGERARAALVAERVELLAGRELEPEPPSWRSDRTERAGAPFWQLVDVLPGVPAADIDGLEAALTVAGLLDAWVTPSGRVELPGGSADIVLATLTHDGSTLSDLLAPLDGTAVPAEVVSAVLGSLPLAHTVSADHPGTDLLLGRDGTFRAGAAFGRGPQRAATTLGAAARERRRQARLSELAEAIDDADRAGAALVREGQDLGRRVAAVEAELSAEPSGAVIDRAVRAVESAEARLAEAQDRLRGSREALGAAETGVRSALRALSTLGATNRLPTEHAELVAVEGALQSMEAAGTAWGHRWRERRSADRTRARAADECALSAAAATAAAEHHRAAASDADDAQHQLAALESTVGTEYREVVTRIGSLDGERQEGRRRKRVLEERTTELARRVGRLEAEAAEATGARERMERSRAEAHRRFGAAVDEGILADAAVGSPVEPSSLDGVTAVLAVARSVSVELEKVEHDARAVERASVNVGERLHQTQLTLRGRTEVTRELSEHGWHGLRAMSGGIRRTVRDLVGALEGELAAGRDELRAEEERLFEQVLAGSVRKALADRIRLASRLVEGINTQLARVRTAAGGVEVRLRWDVDPDQLDAVKAARALLLRNPADLTDSETASLQAFVRARVDQARAELEANAPWEARLRETLDYRAWHRFSLMIGHRDWDGLQPATARRLQRLSTGERSIALHLPMLASIAAHYSDDDGSPSDCPRLILLDELFAGVDTANRAQLFGTFTAWDLDAVFTSDHEWCQYATLDGIAIHHLHPPAGDNPVTSTRFTWDGRHRSIDPSAA